MLIRIDLKTWLKWLFSINLMELRKQIHAWTSNRRYTCVHDYACRYSVFINWKQRFCCSTLSLVFHFFDHEAWLKSTEFYVESQEIQRHLFLGPSTPRFSSKFEDSDSGTGSSNEAHVIRHIDRNILACQICQQRYKEPKVSIT